MRLAFPGVLAAVCLAAPLAGALEAQRPGGRDTALASNWRRSA